MSMGHRYRHSLPELPNFNLSSLECLRLCALQVIPALLVSLLSQHESPRDLSQLCVL